MKNCPFQASSESNYQSITTLHETFGLDLLHETEMVKKKNIAVF